MRQHVLKTLLDRPGGRALLGHLVGRRASSRWGTPIQVFYDDDCWIHRYGDDYLADWQPRSARHLPRSLARYRQWFLSLYAPQAGDTVVDVGAGLGIETILFSRAVGAAGRVVAIEAHPKTFACLRKTCEYNGLSNVTPLSLAVTDKPGEVFIEDDAHHISNSLSTNTDRAGFSVAGVTLDDLAEELGLSSISYLKMNIEGAEQLAIRGMSSIIHRTAVVTIACHDFKADRTGNEFFRTRDTVTRYLKDHGFEIVDIPAENPWDRDHVHAHNLRLSDRHIAPEYRAARAG